MKAPWFWFGFLLTVSHFCEMFGPFYKNITSVTQTAELN